MRETKSPEWKDKNNERNGKETISNKDGDVNEFFFSSIHFEVAQISKSKSLICIS